MHKAYWSIIGLVSMVLAGGCAMHHESKGDLLRQANLSLIDAVRMAEASITGGKTIEAELEREDGRPVYEVKMIDSTQSKRKIHVDAATGKVTKID
jgi:uncharacterized membrane protein YkoI